MIHGSKLTKLVATESTVIVSMTLALGIGNITLGGIYVIWFLYKIHLVIRNRDDLQTYFWEIGLHYIKEAFIIVPCFAVHISNMKRFNILYKYTVLGQREIFSEN